MRVLILAEMPPELANEWMQHVRDFDTAHPGCDFKVAATAPDLTLGQLMEAIKVDPPFPTTEVVRDAAHSDLLKLPKVRDVHVRGGDLPASRMADAISGKTPWTKKDGDA